MPDGAMIRCNFVESDAEVDDWFWATIVELLCSAQEGDRSRAGAQTELDGLMAAYCRAKPNAEISPQRRKKFTILIDTHPQILPPKGFCANWADIERIIKAGVFGDYMHGKWKCARERVQMAALILLLFATSCRPGELVVAGEHDSSQCAKWSDCKFVLHKPALPADPVGLSVEVTIRLLKGRRNDATQTKRIPVVSDHSSAPALDPTLYLFWMAIQDGVFERDFKLEDLATADLSRLPANRTTWELRTNKDALDKPIFPAFKSVSKLAYEADSTRGWTEKDANNRLSAFCGPAGLPDFTLCDVRHFCANALNDPFVTDSDWLRTCEHEAGHRVFVDDCQLDRLEIDVLALLRRHYQRYELIRGRGVPKTPDTDLIRPDELNIVDQDEAVLNAMARVAELKDRLVRETGSCYRRPAGDPLYDEYCSAQMQTQRARVAVRDRIRAERASVLAEAFGIDDSDDDDEGTKPDVRKRKLRQES
ncbi:uncharacterized protein PSANT_06425 [Moesziomyces antarcticus]|nr:uncharacterized protein PSANT_06425 [Moesziomyces antarcticus]